MSSGTSDTIIITDEELSARKSIRFSPVDGEGLEVLPPKITSSDLSEAMNKYVNDYPDFTFEKVGVPDFGQSDCIARHTGIIANQPDFVNDYFFISLMRCVDKMTTPSYVGRIIVIYDTPTVT